MATFLLGHIYSVTYATVQFSAHFVIAIMFIFSFFIFLFYPMALEGHWDIRNEFAIISFHLVLFSSALVELAKFIPLHSLILSYHLFFYLSLLFFPLTVPCRVVFAKPVDLET